MKPTGTRLIVTGNRGVGKSTFCRSISRALQARGWVVAGVLSLPVFERKKQTAIEALDLCSGQRRRLAALNLPGKPVAGPQTERWSFDPQALEWCNQAFRQASPCDVLMVDELGPLEFERQQGFQQAMTAVDGLQYAFAFVVVRQELLEHALRRWPDAQALEVTSPEQAREMAGQWFPVLLAALRHEPGPSGGQGPGTSP